MMPYRKSEYIDFDNCSVILDPMSLSAKKTTSRTTCGKMDLSDKIDLFECRVDVWQLGPAVAMLNQINSASNSSIWCHAAFSLLSCVVCYFEMIGKTLNPKSKTSGTARWDFNYGFCDVYPSFAHGNGSRDDTDIPHVKEFRDRLRNGLYHLAFTKEMLWIHNDTKLTSEDFYVTTDSPPKYLVNPHLLVPRLVNHFPKFIEKIRNPTKSELRQKFEEFFDLYHK